MENRTFTTSVEGITLLKKLVDNQINLGVHEIDGVSLIQLYNQIEGAQTIRVGYATIPEYGMSGMGGISGVGRDHALFFAQDHKVPVIKLIRQVTGLGLKEAKDLSDQAIFCPSANAYKLVLKNLSNDRARDFVRALNSTLTDRYSGIGQYNSPLLINFRSDIQDDSLVFAYTQTSF